MTTPGKPVFGAGSLRYPQIMSPNFNLANPGASPANSWALLQSGLAYLFGVVLSGGTITGPDYVINTAGIFFYSGTPAAGNLAYTLAAAAGTDPFGNAYLDGATNYQQGSPSIAINQSIIGAGSIEWLQAPSYAGPYGIIGSITCDSTGMFLSGGNIIADGLTIQSAPFAVSAGVAATFGGPVTATAGTPARPTLITTDTWHSLGALSGASGYTVNEGRYMLTTDGMTEIDVQLVATAAAASGTYSFATALPAGPTVQRSYPLGYNGAQATGTSWPSLRVGGSVQVQVPALPTGTVLSCTQRVPLNLAGIAGLAPGMRPPVAPSFGTDHHQAFLAYGLHGVMPGVPQVTGRPGGIAVARAVPAVLHWRDRVLSIRKGCWHWRSPLREIAAGAPQPRPRMPSILARRVCARKCAHVRACAERRAGHRGTVRSMIDRDSPAPAWEQLAGILRERIHTGQITVRLPGERALQQEFGLAPATIRRAVRALQSEGLVTTVTGRGTFVVRSEGGAAAERGQ